MSGSGQDNPSGAGSGKPVVRLRGFPKRDAEPPPSTPVIPPPKPGAPPEVRFKRRAPTQPQVEAASQPPPALPTVEEALPPDSVSPAEYPGETVETSEECPARQAEQAFEEPCAEAPVEQPYETVEQPFEEAPAEPYAADAASLEPARSETTHSPDVASFPETIPKPPDPGAAGNPIVTGVRVRMPAKTAPASTEAPARWDASSQAATPPAGPPSASAKLGYTPDTNIERIERRQWWKYDLRVKAGRQPAQEVQEKA